MRLKIYLVALFFIHGSAFSQAVIFPFGSIWKYKDDGSNQGTAWQQAAFDDSGWATGPGKLGFGGDGEVTTLSTGHVTYYFRKSFTIPDVSIYQNFTFDIYRDDGVVVYVNGIEVYRNNMPTGTINNSTLANGPAPDDGGLIIPFSLTLAASQLVSGNNIIAVEIHQSSAISSDISWDMRLIESVPALTRGPYLQMATSTSMLVRWYTNILVDSKVTYGTVAGNLTQSVVVSGTRYNHSIELTGLSPYTKYYYSVGTSAEILQSGSLNYFLTSPSPGATGKYTFWVTGDAGDNSTNQRNVRDRYYNYIGNNITNGWLLLGDNAYYYGTETEYSENFFDQYKDKILRNAPLWPAPGNHDYDNGNNARRNDMVIPYYDIFNLPTLGEVGGTPSNLEAYYSFNYGNIHFISLDSDGNKNGQTRIYDPAGSQMQWLIQDLTNNTLPWVIVYFHHPPYSMGSHNSDTEQELVSIRQGLVPILEQYKVDLVLTGHSHDYERSKLMKGHFGLENSFQSSMHLSQSSGKYNAANACVYLKDAPNMDGTVYIVAGSAGQVGGQQASFPHDAMTGYSDASIGGSLILEVEDNRLDAKWLASDGAIRDNFTIFKNANKVSNISLASGNSVTLDAAWVGQYTWPHSGETVRSVTVNPTVNTTYTVSDSYGCITNTFNITISPLPVELVTFTARLEDEQITLDWKTVSEFNNDFFDVQRFTNHEEIKSLGQVSGHGTTAETNNYHFVDFSPVQGVAYYRLKQVDYDGGFEYSNVIRVDFNGTRSVQLFPNPGNGTELRLAMGLDEGPLSISILDIRGQKVSSFFADSTLPLSPNQPTIKFETPLSQGLYSVQIKSKAGIITRKWIVK